LDCTVCQTRGVVRFFSKYPLSSKNAAVAWPHNIRTGATFYEEYTSVSAVSAFLCSCVFGACLGDMCLVRVSVIGRLLYYDTCVWTRMTWGIRRVSSGCFIRTLGRGAKASLPKNNQRAIAAPYNCTHNLDCLSRQSRAPGIYTLYPPLSPPPESWGGD
jgi:hypothetical protein